MRLINLLNEKTSTNQGLVRLLATLILKQFEKQSGAIRGGDHAKVDVTFTKDEWEEISDTYGDYGTTLARFISENIPVYLANGYSSGNYSTSGAYVHRTGNIPSGGYIVIYLPSTTNWEPSVPFSPTNISQNTPVVGVLMHEIRHVMQRNQFNRFFNKRTATMSKASASGDGVSVYRKDPLEIDAALVHIIHNNEGLIDVDPQEFVDSVMKDFEEYKDLTSKQVEHYRRKVATYASDRLGKSKSSPKIKAPERLAQLRKARDERRIDKFIDTVKNSMRDLTSLSNIGMDGSKHNTTYNSSAFGQVLISLARNNQTMKPEFVAQNLFALSVINTWAKFNDVNFDPTVITDLLADANVSLDAGTQQTIDIIKEKSFFDPYDRALIIRWVKRLKNDVEELYASR